MATRNNLRQTQKTRDNIRGSQLVNTLQNHVLEDKELSATQIQAAKILLAKILPDVKQVEHSGEIDAFSFNAVITYK